MTEMRNLMNMVLNEAQFTSKSLIDFDGMEQVEAHIGAVIDYFANLGFTESCGRERTVFYRRNNVVKIPLTDSGCLANSRERRMFARMLNGKTDIPIAACRIYRTPVIGLPLLFMSTVVPLLGGEKLPFWADFVDCQQVGHDRKGNLVAYDL